MYILCLSVCLFVCMDTINVKTAKPIGPIFVCDLTWPQGRFMNDQNFKNLSQTKFDFYLIFKNFENPTKFVFEIRDFLNFILQCTQREHVREVP